MASIRYDKIPLILEYYGRTEKVLAYDCSLSEEATLEPVYALGKQGIAEQTPAGARKASVSFSYTPVLTGESTVGNEFNIINRAANKQKTTRGNQALEIKHGTIAMRFGGISGEGILESYSVSLEPYAPVTCNVNFLLFGSGENVPISGELISQDQAYKQADLASDVGHTAYSDFMAGESPATITSDNQTGVLTSVNYSINFNYEPVYKLGQEFPSTFLYHSANEQAKIEENTFETGIAFTGKAENFDLEIKSLDNKTAMRIRMTKPVVKDSRLSVSAGDIASTSKTLNSFY